jgi:outer membrane protein assembly factor BamB
MLPSKYSISVILPIVLIIYLQQDTETQFNEKLNSTHHDWPQWRGLNRDGISKETEILKTWPRAGPRAVWRVQLGEGFSSIAIAHGRAYTMFSKGNDEHLVCFDASTGAEKWRFRTDDKFRNSWGNGPRVTPTVDGDQVYTISANAKLYALDAQTGARLWQHDLPKEFGGSIPDLGYSNSPLVAGELLLVAGCGGSNQSILAFNRQDGRLAWSSYSDHPGYSSPIMISTQNISQAIFFMGSSIVAVSPADGKLLWNYTWRSSDFENTATPIFIPTDKLFFSSPHPRAEGTVVLQVTAPNGRATATPSWKNNVMQLHFASAVLHENFLYGTDRYILKCIDARTGEPKWQQRGFGEGSLIMVASHLLVLGTSGNLALAEAAPEAYREKASAQILKGRCFTPPAFANGKLYLRNETEIVCLNLFEP